MNRHQRGDERIDLLDGMHEHYHIRLESFEGPMDLLLHLIKKNELDIQNISISLITSQYLEYINLMKELNLEIAGEFLVMAATLLQIKSKSLLPVAESEDEEIDEEDPKTELIRRLIEYQQYKEAGELLSLRPTLNREVFTRQSMEEFETDTESEALEVSIFDLVEAFKNLLKRVPVESFHDVAAAERFSINDAINEILSMLHLKSSLNFEDIISDDNSREKIIVTFLAILELCRLKVIRIFQNSLHGNIWFVPAAA